MENNDPVGGVAVPTEPTAPLKLHDNPARTGADRPIDPVEGSAGAPAPKRAKAMSTADAVAECRRWLAHLEAQRKRSLELQRLAADRRSGYVSRGEAARRMSAIDCGVKVYDGSELERAVTALLAALPPSHERGR